MRSRYSAYALGNAGYLLRTWHWTTRPASLDLPESRRWTRLRILATEHGAPDDTEGTVEFRAHFRDDGEPGTLTERSHFTRARGAWIYVGGEVAG